MYSKYQTIIITQYQKIRNQKYNFFIHDLIAIMYGYTYPFDSDLE